MKGGGQTDRPIVFVIRMNPQGITKTPFEFGYYGTIKTHGTIITIQIRLLAYSVKAGLSRWTRVETRQYFDCDCWRF